MNQFENSPTKEFFLETILDPEFLLKFNRLLKYGIPLYQKDEFVFLGVISGQKNIIEFGNISIKTVPIAEEDFFEKRIFIKNVNKWDENNFIEENSPIRSVLDYIFLKSILKNASDIHIDINNDFYSIKLRINSILENFIFLSKAQGDSVLMRLKVISSLDTSETRFPQSGSFNRFFKDQNIDFRVSTHPTVSGERIVIRILQNKRVPNLKEIGFSERVYNIAREVVEKPYGLIIFTGPTNSGKTTSIHSILKEISNSGINIMTLEDPVEYKIPGIIQTNITSLGIDYFEGMKSLLRQDPDVIFLGEIRDSKTAKIAAQAAMTGHKILTTLHTSSIKGAISRLNDLGVSYKIIAEVLVAVFAQRLLRKADNSGLCLAADAFLFNQESYDDLIKENTPKIMDNLKEEALLLQKKGIVENSEIKRIIG